MYLWVFSCADLQRCYLVVAQLHYHQEVVVRMHRLLILAAPQLYYRRDLTCRILLQTEVVESTASSLTSSFTSGTLSMKKAQHRADTRRCQHSGQYTPFERLSRLKRDGTCQLDRNGRFHSRYNTIQYSTLILDEHTAWYSSLI